MTIVYVFAALGLLLAAFAYNISKKDEERLRIESEYEKYLSLAAARRETDECSDCNGAPACFSPPNEVAEVTPAEFCVSTEDNHSISVEDNPIPTLAEILRPVEQPAAKKKRTVVKNKKTTPKAKKTTKKAKGS